MRIADEHDHATMITATEARLLEAIVRAKQDYSINHSMMPTPANAHELEWRLVDHCQAIAMWYDLTEETVVDIWEDCGAY